MTEFYELPDGKAVCFNPGGRFHGWLFFRHPDGQLVSERKLVPTEANPPGSPLHGLFIHSAPKADGQ